jgi:ribosomal protein L24E
MKDYNNENNKICCSYCGKDFSQNEDWPYVEGDSNRGVLKIEHFCSEEHKHNFFTSRK